MNELQLQGWLILIVLGLIWGAAAGARKRLIHLCGKVDLLLASMAQESATLQKEVRDLYLEIQRQTEAIEDLGHTPQPGP